ncbi:hypothetical protein D3C75_911510 [compost metagenome]
MLRRFFPVRSGRIYEPDQLCAKRVLLHSILLCAQNVILHKFNVKKIRERISEGWGGQAVHGDSKGRSVEMDGGKEIGGKGPV